MSSPATSTKTLGQQGSVDKGKFLTPTLSSPRTLALLRSRSDYIEPTSPTSAETRVPLSSLPGIQNFASRSLMGLLKAFAQAHRSPRISMWSGRVGSPVTITNGISAGWAIEGAVGSSQKIDATYLSPHVNGAARMMSACGQFGVSLIMHKSFAELLPNEAKQGRVRLIDRVVVKGESEPAELYAYDARYEGVPFFMNAKSSKVADLESRNLDGIWTRDKDLLSMTRHIEPEFLEAWERGFNSYQAGRFGKAIKELKAANALMRKSHYDMGFDESGIREIMKQRESGDNWDDGPCQALILFMEDYLVGSEVEVDDEGIVVGWAGKRAITKR